MGRDPDQIGPPAFGADFNPLSPHGERPAHQIGVVIPADFNPLSPHGERPPPCSWNDHIGFISIHSPRMGRDLNVSGRRTTSPFQSTLPAWGETFFPFCPSDLRDISIHSPRMGRDQIVVDYFNSHMDNFNPLSPHGERRRRRIHHAQHEQISIHSPRMGRDCGYWRRTACTVGFQSTLPAWGETLAAAEPLRRAAISIHSPRMGRDMLCELRKSIGLISIHSPRMGRDCFCACLLHQRGYISIHSPRMGRDPASPFSFFAYIIFQSTLPAWGETIGAGGLCDGGQYFNPLSPHGERRYRFENGELVDIFQSTLPAWGETLHYIAKNQIMRFQSTLPAWGETL